VRDFSGDDQRFCNTVEQQWGVITLAQLRALGWGEGAIRHAIARRRLLRLHRGVYAVGHRRLHKQGRWLAAVLTSGEGAALSFAAAADHLDLRTSGARVVDVTVPCSRRAQPGIRLHRPRVIEPGDVRTHEGIPTTSPTRTLIDLATVLPMPALERVVAEVEHRGLLDADRLGRARSRKLDAIFDGGRRRARTRSQDEARVLRAIRSAGLPEPEMNAWMTHGGGEEWQVDVLFHDARVIIEVDDDRHRTRHAFELDRHKDAVRQAAGFRTLRVTRRQIREDLPRFVALVARTLDTALRNR